MQAPMRVTIETYKTILGLGVFQMLTSEMISGTTLTDLFSYLKLKRKKSRHVGRRGFSYPIWHVEPLIQAFLFISSTIEPRNCYSVSCYGYMLLALAKLGHVSSISRGHFTG